jgi:hypothetical protein
MSAKRVQVTAYVVSTAKAFSIMVGHRYVYSAEGPFSLSEAMRLGNYMWEVFDSEGVTHMSENGGPVQPVAQPALYSDVVDDDTSGTEYDADDIDEYATSL